MIQVEEQGKIITYKCRSCGSTNIVKNGTNRLGHQQYLCKDCKARRVLISRREEKASEKKEYPKVLKACLERVSLRGVCRIFNLSRATLNQWLVDRFLELPPLTETLCPAEKDEVLEWDEGWSFVACKRNPQWLWTAMCRRTRQIVAYALGDRSVETGRMVWNRLPQPYQEAYHYSDLWLAYQLILPPERHSSVGKGSGQTNHQERWYNTLRQWCSRYTRRTLSFSKTSFYHRLFTEWFIIEHNLKIKQSSLT